MIEFLRGIRTSLSTTLIPASARIMSNNAGYLPSRSRMRNRAAGVVEVHDGVARCLGDPRRGRVRGGAEDAHPSGGVLDDREDVHPLPDQRHSFEEVGSQDRVGLGSQERRPGRVAPLGCRVNSGFPENLPDGGRGDLDAQDEQLAVDAPVAPRAVLPRQAQHKNAYRSDGAWPSRTLRTRDPGVTCGDQVTVPTQHGLRTHQQSDLAQHVTGEPVQQGSKEGPIGRCEPDPRTVQLPPKDRDLMAKREDLGVLGAVAHREQSKHRYRVCRSEIGQSTEHSRASSPIGRQRYERPGG
jgi:hypothetical protein